MHQQQLKNFNMTFGIDTAACNIVVLAHHPAARGYLIHKDSLLGCAYSTASQWLLRVKRSIADDRWWLSLRWPTVGDGQKSALQLIGCAIPLRIRIQTQPPTLLHALPISNKCH